MSWALELKKDILRYRENLQALQKHDANLQHTLAILSQAREKADKTINEEREKIEEQIGRIKVEMEAGDEILRLKGELVSLQESLSAAQQIVAEGNKLNDRYSDFEKHYQILLGNRLHYERLLAERKRKFWKSSTSYKNKLVNTFNAIEALKAKKEEIRWKQKEREQEFLLNAANANRLRAKIQKVQTLTETLLKNAEKKISDLHSRSYDLFFRRKLNEYLTGEEKLFIAQAISFLGFVDMQLMHKNYPELSQVLTLLINYRDPDRNCYEAGTLWDKGGITFLAKEKYKEIFEYIDGNEAGKYKITVMDDEISSYPEFLYETILTEDALDIFEEYVKETEVKQENATEEPNEDADIVIDVDINWTVSFPQGTFKHVLGTEESLSLFSSNILDEMFLNAILNEIEKDEEINFPTLVLNVWETDGGKKIKTTKSVVKLVKELKRLFELSPEQMLVEEQRYYRQREIKQLEENAWLERKQRDEHARLERKEIEYQAELDRKQQEEMARRAEKAEKAWRAEQIRIQRENAEAEQHRWEEDKRREDERRKAEERERMEQKRREEQEKRDMRHLCWKCANYCHGCHGGIPRCGNFKSK